jgi:putative phage-type endonuclease
VLVVDHQEGTDAWRAWRHGGIGSSDAPAIVGLSRYGDARSLWQRKRRPPERPADDLRLARGRALEPEARRATAAFLGADLAPRCCQHDRHPELRASLDGWSDELQLPVEIKCVGRGRHAEALGGVIPRPFVPQCLHILVVTGAARLIYASYQPAEPRHPLALVELARPDALCEALARIELDFWRAVQEGVPFPATSLPPFDLRTRRLAAP